MSIAPRLEVQDISGNIIVHVPDVAMTVKPKLSYAAMLAAPKPAKIPKIDVPITTKIDNSRFGNWLYNAHELKRKSSRYPFPLRKPLSPLICHERVKIWHDDPLAAIATHSVYSTGTLDYQDHMIFIHSFPEIFDLLIHSNFACSTLGPRTDSTDSLALHIVLYAQVFRPSHSFYSMSIPCSMHHGPLVYTVNPEDKVCFHKCYEPVTGYVTDNSRYYGWLDIDNYLKTKTFPLVNTVDYSKFPGYNASSSDIQIFWTTKENVLTFIMPDQTVYRVFQLV